MLEINNLAFAGGEVKVIVYAGALKALKDKDCLKKYPESSWSFRWCNSCFLHSTRISTGRN